MEYLSGITVYPILQQPNFYSHNFVPTKPGESARTSAGDLMSQFGRSLRHGRLIAADRMPMSGHRLRPQAAKIRVAPIVKDLLRIYWIVVLAFVIGVGVRHNTAAYLAKGSLASCFEVAAPAAAVSKPAYGRCVSLCWYGWLIIERVCAGNVEDEFGLRSCACDSIVFFR
jgi:hypothetical protein